MSLRSFFDKGKIEAGCDEAGRGCLAGPVFAASVVLPKNFKLPGLNDSKKIGKGLRDELRKEIESKALAWAVVKVGIKEIDRLNILWASVYGMHKAIERLATTPELLLIDGNRFKPYKDIPHHCIIKGDSKFKSIAAASILAKTHRDEYMGKLSKSFPDYGWASNKGYPTKSHRAAIAKFGATKHHRLSFKLLPD